MKVHGIDASYYFVQDFDRANAFYTEFFGTPPTQQMPGMFAEWVLGDDAAFGIYKSDDFRPSDGIMFAVDDVHKAIAELKARGVEIKADGYVEDTPVCHMAFAADSEGNGFILHKRK